MAIVKLVQTDFTSGEISSKMIARTDIESFKHGAKEITNAYPLPHGACTSRRGTIFLGEVRNSELNTKMIPFIYSRTQSFALLFNDGYCRIIKNGAYVLSSGLPYEFIIPYLDDELEDIRYTQVGNVLYLVHPNHQPKQIRRVADDSWTISNIDFNYNAVSDYWYENANLKFKIISGTTDFVVGDSFFIDTSSGVSWVKGTLPSSRNWVDVVYGTDKFVAIAANSAVAMTAPKGTTWTGRTLPATRNWSGIAFGAGKYVTCANASNTWAKSTDGITWSSLSVGTSAAWTSITYGNGKFVAIASGGTSVLYSTDAVTWNAATLPSSQTWTKVVCGGGSFVAIASGTNVCATSIDGITWTSRTLPTNTTWTSVVYGNGTFAAIASGGTVAAYSTDGGANWTSATLPSTGSWKSITYGNGTFVAIASSSTATAVSNDGITWIAGTINQSLNWNVVYFNANTFISLPNTSNLFSSGTGGTLTIGSNTGNGTITAIDIKGTTSELWSISCVLATAERQEWEVVGSVSGTLISTWTTNNYPQTVVFHEQRLYFGGTPNEPQTIWGSAIGNFTEFTLGPKDNDALQFTIASNQYDEMINMSSGRYLIPFTYGGEFAMMGSTTTGITPSTVRIMPQTYHGSNNMVPLKIGKEILFCQRDGKKVRAVSYSTAEDANTAPDISVLAEHLLQRKVRESAFAQDPDYVSWWVMDDGSLLSCVHMRDFSMTGWSKHDTDGGLFRNVICIPETNQDTVYFIVERTVNETTYKFIEYFDYQNEIYSDCSLIGTSITPTTLWSGLTHLNGKTVTIVGDGVVQPSKLVTAGSIVLDKAASEVKIGLAYTPLIKLHHPVIPNVLGTSQDGKVSINKIVVNLQDTVGLKVNGTEIPFRKVSIDLLDTPIAKFSGVKDIKNLGWGTQEYMVLEQPYPLPWTVLSTTLYVISND
jgi:hypothetical protein